MENGASDGRCLLSGSDTGTLLSPIQSSPRIKVAGVLVGAGIKGSLLSLCLQYTCVASSRRYIALGANTGGVYCFHKMDYRYIRILANQVSALACNA